MGDNFDQQTDTGEVNHALGIGFDLGNALVGAQGKIGELPEQLLQVVTVSSCSAESRIFRSAATAFRARRCRSRTSSFTAGRWTRLGL